MLDIYVRYDKNYDITLRGVKHVQCNIWCFRVISPAFPLSQCCRTYVLMTFNGYVVSYTPKGNTQFAMVFIGAQVQLRPLFFVTPFNRIFTLTVSVCI